MAMTSTLFVYGTLRKDARNSMYQLLMHQATFVGCAWVQGRLFNLGEYPGLVPSFDSGSWVQGEVYALDNPLQTLSRLDEYEGCAPSDPEPHEFERVELDVVMKSGKRENAWAYVYKGSTMNKREILTGDYLKEPL